MTHQCLYCTVPRYSDTLTPCIARYHAILIPCFLNLNCDTLIWPVDYVFVLCHDALTHNSFYSSIQRWYGSLIACTTLYHADMTNKLLDLHCPTQFWPVISVSELYHAAPAHNCLNYTAPRWYDPSMLVLHCTTQFSSMNSLYLTLPRGCAPLLPCSAMYHAVLISYILVLHCTTLFRPLNYLCCTPLYHAAQTHNCLYYTVPSCSGPSIFVLHGITLFWHLKSLYCTVSGYSDPLLP